LTGPYGQAFEVPEETDANLILIGAGTGIAPFRAFVNHLYRNVPEFKGHVRLFHGGRTGLDLLYMNDQRNDFAQYYDEDTFDAITALSARPHWSDAIDWSSAMESRGEELWKMLSDASTYVYIAGLESIRDELEAVFVKIAGSEEKWARRKAELQAGKRWIELLY
jgi:ferredoxin--NADP+ reductase